ncbi:MAG TPA: DeoR/GlpR family DNA-binding transcription regulator [Microlunatus sp.]
MIVPADAAADRHRRIIDRLDAFGRVGVVELAGRLDVAPETVRRDLRQLEVQGLLQRVHGGAVRRTERPLSPFDGTTPEHPPLHVRLADLVVERLPAHGTVLLAGSPFTWAVAESMSRHPAAVAGLTVVTTGLDVAVVLSRVENLSVYNIGGSVEPEHRAQEGEWALDELRRFRVDLALLSPSGVNVDGGVFAPTPMAAAISAASIEIAQRVWLMLDGQAVGHIGVVRAAGLDGVDHVFTAGAAAPSHRQSLHEAGINLTTAEEPDHPTRGRMERHSPASR